MKVPFISSSLEDFAKAKKYYRQGRTAQALHHGTQGAMNVTVPAVIGGVAYDLHKENKMVKEELKKLKDAGLTKQSDYLRQSGFSKESALLSKLVSRAGKAARKVSTKAQRVSRKWGEKVEKLPLALRIPARAVTLPGRLAGHAVTGIKHGISGAGHAAEFALKNPLWTAGGVTAASAIPVGAAAKQSFLRRQAIGPRATYGGQFR